MCDNGIVLISAEEKTLNAQQFHERIQAVKDTGLADEVIPEEHIGQKIDDIRRYHIDVFAIGSDQLQRLPMNIGRWFICALLIFQYKKLRQENSGIRLYYWL